MPGTITVDQQSTFSKPPLAMGVGPKLTYGTDEQDRDRDGQRKWVVQVAVSYFPEYGRSVAEVIEVGFTGEAPAVEPGQPVQFDRLRVGFSAPSVNAKGRVQGGKPFWQADAVRPFSDSSNGRQLVGAKSE